MSLVFHPDWTPGGPLDSRDLQLNTKEERAIRIITTESDRPHLYLHEIEKINSDHPNWPFGLVRLGRAYLLLEDLHGALEQFEKALGLLPPRGDEKFAAYVRVLRAYVERVEAEEDNEWSDPADGIIVSHWTPPKDITQYTFSEPALTPAVMKAWNALIANDDDNATVTQRYARLLSIETNEIERVFVLGGESLPRLVRVGFFTGAIDYVEEQGMQEYAKIIAVLKDVQRCLEFISTAIGDSGAFDEEMLREVHRLVVSSCRIGSIHSGDDLANYLTHGGVYRKRLITTSLTPETANEEEQDRIVQYTHQSQVASEMKIFIGMMKDCLSTTVSPFAAAAWIHTVFARIHPFTDGNGRVARLIASISLIRAGYPFINIRGHLQERYLEAIFQAQTTTNLETLVDIFASSMLDSIEYIRSLPPPSPDDKQYQFSLNPVIAKLSLS